MIEEQVLTMILRGGTTGIVECSLDEWYGISYKIPRTRLKEASSLNYIDNTGVYILFGEDENSAEKIAYIGEAEDIYKRLEQHNRTKDFWNECIVFMSENNSLNKAHIKYIENELYMIACETGRYVISNDVKPTKSSLGTADEIKSQKFVEKIKIITSAMGYRIFDKLVNVENDNSNLLYLNYKGELLATAIVTDEGFVILKGSRVSENQNGVLSEGLINYFNRERASSDIENNVYIRNHLVSSPSMAGVIILGRNANGRTVWKNKDGITLKELQEKGLI